MNQMRIENQMVFVDEEYGFPRYQIGFTGKDKQGNFHNIYLETKMPKDMPVLADRTKINCDAYLAVSAWRDKNGEVKKKLVLFAKNVTLADGTYPTDKAPEADNYDGFEGVQESIPF